MIKTYCLLALLCGSAMLSACAHDDHASKEHSSEVSYRDERTGPSAVIAPVVPERMTFAGEEIDLSRYDRRERLDREFISFSYAHTTSLLMLKRANRYFPLIEKILKEEGVPDDFKYLAAIESFMDPTVKSPAGAAGLWQFMEATGKEYKLEVNSNVDERYHIEKSTRAACKYIKDAYAKTGDWLSVAAAYNAGQNRITGELRRQEQQSAMDLWLVTETSRYMFRLLAAKAFFENPQQFGFVVTANQLYPPMEYKEVVVTESIDSLTQFAKAHGVSYYDIKQANLWLRGRSLPVKANQSYRLLVPTKASLHYKPEKIKAHNPNWVVKP